MQILYMKAILETVTGGMCIGRTDAKAEAPILWLLEAKSQLIGKDPDAGKDWRQEEKGTTKDEMVGWHHQLDGHEFEQAPGVGDGREAWHTTVHGVTESDMTEWLNNNKIGRDCLSFFTEVFCSYFRVSELEGRRKSPYGDSESIDKLSVSCRFLWHSKSAGVNPWHTVYSFPGVSITSDHSLQSWGPEDPGQGVGMAVPSGARLCLQALVLQETLVTQVLTGHPSVPSSNLMWPVSPLLSPGDGVISSWGPSAHNVWEALSPNKVTFQGSKCVYLGSMGTILASTLGCITHSSIKPSFTKRTFAWWLRW